MPAPRRPQRSGGSYRQLRIGVQDASLGTEAMDLSQESESTLEMYV